MSATIIPFPGREMAINSASGPLRAMVEVDRMRNFRMLGRSTMRQLSLAQASLAKLVVSCSRSGQAADTEELRSIMWQYAEALRCIDWAHKVLVVHGQPIGDADSYNALRRQYRKEIANKPPVEVDENLIGALLSALGGLEDD